MNESFELCLSARLEWVGAVVWQSFRETTMMAATARQQAFQTLDRLAALEAYRSDPVYGARVPPLLVDTPELANHYHAAFVQIREFVEELIAEEDQRRAQELLEADIEQRCQARLAQDLITMKEGRWDELNLPFPAEFLQRLIAGESVDVEGHTFSFDEADDITWFDNPYAVPGGFSGAPTMELCTRILRHIGGGGMYGPEPPT